LRLRLRLRLRLSGMVLVRRLVIVWQIRRAGILRRSGMELHWQVLIGLIGLQGQIVLPGLQISGQIFLKMLILLIQWDLLKILSRG
jgi:hypothetical protein